MTVKEIAALAGTSRGTVDRILNNRGNVSPEVKERVLRIVEETQYQPNHLARGLIKSRKHLRLGVVINSIGNPFFDDVLRGIYNRAGKLGSYGVDLQVKECKGYEAGEQITAVQALLDEGIDGLCIMPINVPEIRRYLSGLEVPIVTFNTDIDIPNKLAFVGCDYFNSGQVSGDLARLILSAGGKAAVVIGSLKVAGHNERVCGFSKVLEREKDIEIVAVAENDDDDRCSYRLVKKIIEEKEPDLVYFGAGGIDGGIRAVLESGRNIRVLAVDETEAVRRHMQSGPVCATVTQQPFEQGDRAIKILFDYLDTKKKPREVNQYTSNQILLKSSK